jgi:hypothetical protein
MVLLTLNTRILVIIFINKYQYGGTLIFFRFIGRINLNFVALF